MINKIAITSIAIGLGVMIVSVQILEGFEEEIRNKIISFGGHLQVTKFNLSQSYEEDPISRNNGLVNFYKNYDYIEHVQPYAHKAGLMKANEEVMGILLKGVSKDFDLTRFQQNMIDGSFITFNDTTDTKEIVISQEISKTLDLHTGSDAIVYFMQNPVRVRRLKVSGIYKTGMEDFDEKIIIGDLKMVQRINDWPDSLVGGFEVFIDDFHEIDRYQRDLYNLVSYDHYVEKITDKYLEIFDWLSLLNRNVVIFLTLILAVASFNMISILLILIMERTQMIGTLKALGAHNKQIRKIFVYNGMRLIIKGLLIGNFIGIGFGFIQDRFNVLGLDSETYYMEYVPIHWNWTIIILLNCLIFLIVSVVLMLPTMIISRISPIKSIRFD